MQFFFSQSSSSYSRVQSIKDAVTVYICLVWPQARSKKRPRNIPRLKMTYVITVSKSRTSRPSRIAQDMVNILIGRNPMNFKIWKRDTQGPEVCRTPLGRGKVINPPCHPAQADSSDFQLRSLGIKDPIVKSLMASQSLFHRRSHDSYILYDTAYCIYIYIQLLYNIRKFASNPSQSGNKPLTYPFIFRVWPSTSTPPFPPLVTSILSNLVLPQLVHLPKPNDRRWSVTARSHH